MNLREIALTLFLIFSSFLTQNLHGQEKEIILLNQHFYPIENSDRDSYFYQAITSKDVNGNTIERIFTPTNQLVRITRYSFNEEGQFNQEEIENYNLSGELVSHKTKNADNGLFLTKYYSNGEYIGEALFTVDRTYEITKPGSNDIITTELNEFEAVPFTDKKLWQKHLISNLRYPTQARSVKAEGTIILAMLVSQEGELKKIEIANPVGIHKSLKIEALRVAESYKGRFLPGRDLNGNPVESWLYVPIRFKLS